MCRSGVRGPHMVFSGCFALFFADVHLILLSLVQRTVNACIFGVQDFLVLAIFTQVFVKKRLHLFLRPDVLGLLPPGPGVATMCQIRPITVTRDLHKKPTDFLDRPFAAQSACHRILSSSIASISSCPYPYAPSNTPANPYVAHYDVLNAKLCSKNLCCCSAQSVQLRAWRR